MAKAKLRRWHFARSPENDAQIAPIRRASGSQRDADAVRYALAEAAGRLSRNDRRAAKSDTPEGDAAGARSAEAEESRCRVIADKLGGTIERQGDGWLVSYKTHSLQGSYPQRVPLLSLTEELLANQWFPDEATVRASWAKGKA